MSVSGNVKPVAVSIGFTISTEGRAENIECRSLEGKMTQRSVLRLIQQGAARTRFEPLVIEEVAYEIVGLIDTFVLGDVF